MKVKMKTLASGPQGSWHEGNVYDLPDAQAEAFIDGGYAVSLEPKAVAAVVPVKPIEPKPAPVAAKSEKTTAKPAAAVSPTSK